MRLLVILLRIINSQNPQKNSLYLMHEKPTALRPLDAVGSLAGSAKPLRLICYVLERG